MIDFTDVLTDPELGARTLQCERTTQTVTPRGRADNVTNTFPLTGITTQDKGAIMARIGDGTYVEGSMLIHTYTMLQDAKRGEPDVIIDPKDNGRYVVATRGDYSEHGFNWAIIEPYGVQP